jgi:acyl carrier protein
MSMPVTPDPYKFFLLFFLLYGVISPFIFWGVSVYYSRKYKRKHEQFLKKSSASNVTNEGKTNLSASKINEKSHSILESAHMQDNNKTAENEKSKRISESSKIVTQNKTGLTSVEKEAVIEILTDKLGIDRSEIHNDAEFVNDLDVDSLDAIMLIMELEDKFGIIIHDEDAEKIRTVGDLFDYLSPLLSSKNGISEIPKNLN